jgi:hypothetical protein
VTSATTPKLIGVTPAAAVRHTTLFTALERVFPVRFVPRSPAERRDLDALVVFSSTAGPLGEAFPLPTLVISGEEGRAAGVVRFARHTSLHPVFHGRTLEDERAEGDGPPLEVRPEDVVASSSSVVWAVTRTPDGTAHHATRVSPEPLGATEVLRDRLRPGRFLELLPLLHFLSEVSEPEWRQPPLRAAFIIDDPNLHWPSYGHVDFRQIVQHASVHDYHVAFATIPLDAYCTHPTARRAFAQHPDRISLAVHGNNHTHEEMLHVRSREEALALVAQAVARISRLEQRTGVEVSRVMVAPHGLFSEVVLRAMFELGFDSACASWPFPWPPLRPPRGWVLAGWEPAQFVAGGMSVLFRTPFSEPLDDLLFRAYLGHPLIVFGHHGDAANGLAALDRTADYINRLGNVTWSNLTGIARSSALVRQDGAAFVVRPYATRVRVSVPPVVQEVRVEVPSIHGMSSPVRVVAGGEARPVCPLEAGEAAVTFPACSPTIDVCLTPGGTLSRASIGRPAFHPWPPVRRGLTEARDRLQPVRGRLRSPMR